jgi:hypothetical protein
MAFSYQKSVALENKKAIAGDRANNQIAIYAPTNFTTAAAVKVGGFVWRDTTNPETQVKASTSGSGAPLGFMERVQNFPNYNISTEGTLEIPAGCEVNVAVKGDFFVVADGAVDVGDKVYAVPATGAVSFTSTDNIDSGFVAFTSASASGELVIITNS